MKKLCIFTLYSKNGASSNYRILQYLESLQREYEIRCYSFWNDAYLKKFSKNKKKYFIILVILYFVSAISRIFQICTVASKCDIVFIQKACIPKCSLNFVKYLRKRGVHVIFDVDDAVYFSKGDKSMNIAKNSNAVICGNSVLLNHYRIFNRNIFVIPTIDKNEKYSSLKNYSFKDKTIGWIGTCSTIKCLDIIIEPVNNIIKKHPEVKFLIISDSTYGYESKIYNVVFKKWNADSYIESLSNITVGIMPLEDSSFNRGKCGFKLVQYLSLEKPVIASNVGINSEIVKNRGYVVRTSREWEEALENLLFNRENYDICIHNIQNSFVEEFGFDIVFSSLVKVLEC